MESFGYALARVKAGQRFRRLGWPATLWIALVRDGRAKVSMIGEEAEVPFAPFLVLHTGGGQLVPYLPTQADLLAENWAPFDERTS